MLMSRMLIGIAAAAAVALPAQAEETYAVGLTAALTGPAASTYAAAAEALRIYFDRVNAAGGINGKKVQLVVQDDSGEPSKAAANAKKLLTQDNAILLLNDSVSSTQAPVVAEAKRAGVPLMFANSVCPKETYPPADEGQFCTTAFAANYDSRGALYFIKEKANEPVRIAFAAMAIPVSRAEVENGETLAPTLGMTAVDKEIIPMATADYMPFATKIKDADANWVFSWAPWVTQVRTFEALRRLGWQGEYIAFALLEAENELKRIKDDKLFVIGANAMLQDDLPIHREIIDAARKANASYPPEQLIEGWIAAMVVEAALKGAGWPATPAKVQASMQNLKVDLKGLRGGPIEWTKDNHFRTRQYYRVYNWDSATSRIARAKDWFAFDVK